MENRNTNLRCIKVYGHITVIPEIHFVLIHHKLYGNAALRFLSISREKQRHLYAPYLLLLRNWDDLYLSFPISLCFIFVEFHSWWSYHSIRITVIVNVGFGAKSIVRMKAMSPNHFVLLLDDTPEDHLMRLERCHGEQTFSLLMIQTPY